MNSKAIYPYLVLAVAFLFIACKNEFTPKPKGYFRIDFPQKSYVQSPLDAPYHFEYPSYASLKADSSNLSEPYWMNINIDRNKAKIHISYKSITNNLLTLCEDSRELAYKHSIKANAINEKQFINLEKNVFGTIYEIKGNVASPFQFYLTDSTRHFVRASLYISEIPNYDSLRPVIHFIEEDIYHLIETFSWK